MAKAKKKTKRIIKAKIDFISLVPKGANCLSTIYKSDGGNTNVDLQTICKDMNELGEIIAVVYAPEMEDSQGDIASAAVIKDFAHDFQKNGAGVDIRHEEEALSKDAVFVAESFIVQKDDPRFADMTDYDDNVVDVTGGWGVVIKVDDEELRKLYRSGEWSGVSMGGTAIKKSDEDTGLIEKFFIALDTYKGSKKPKSNKSKKNAENNMALTEADEKKIAETVIKTMAEVTKKADEAAAEALKKEEAEGAKLGMGFTAPVLPASPSEADIQKHRRNLKIFELSKTVDSTSEEAIFEFTQKSAEIATCKDLSKVIEKQSGSQYDTFYVSNQSVGDVKKGSDNTDTDDNADIILKELDEEEAAANTAA